MLTAIRLALADEKQGKTLIERTTGEAFPGRANGRA